MQFVGELTEKQLSHVNQCNARLNDPERLIALQNTGLLDTPREEAFDRLCRLAAQILNVPLTIVSLVDNKRQFFKGDFGLPSPFSETRHLPIDFSLCRYTMAGDSIISNDTSKDDFLVLHPSTKPWGIGSLIVLPLINDEGHVLGTFCCIQPEPRVWSELDHEVMRELTASIMTEINLRSQISKLKVEQNLRDTFVAAMTHDLRTPLTVIKMSAQIMLKKIGENSEYLTPLKRIIESSDRSDGMIQNLLEVNQIKSGTKIALKMEGCNISQIINEVSREVSTIHQCEFKMNICKDLSLQGDASALRRIVENLMSNAAKYGDHKKPISVELFKDGSQVTFRVQNFGNLISEIDQAKIFEAFHRTIDATNSQQKGWGLGLPLVRGLVEAHAGKIVVSSSLEEGTVFLVVFPWTETR